MFTIFGIDQWGEEHEHKYHTRDEAEEGAVRLLRAGYVRTKLFDPRYKEPVMVLTQGQLKLFENVERFK